MRVLVIAAHPDDEILGCGGTVIRHVNNGDEVRSVIVCEGESLRYKDTDVHQAESSKKAAAYMGVKELIRLDFPDQRLDTYSLVDIIKPIEEIVKNYQPQIVYVQFGGDINRDHQIVFEASMVALRPSAASVEEIYSFYTVGSTELAVPVTFQPDTWVDISNTIDVKIKAFCFYESEVREYPHPRSSEGLRNIAKYFGNQCSMCAAESFVTIRRIVH